MTNFTNPIPTNEDYEKAPNSAGEPAQSKRSFLFEVLQTLVLAALLYFGIDEVFARVRVLNISMQPTLVEGDVILVNKLAYKLGSIQTGDVVIFHDPFNDGEDFIKRVIGKPGDQIDVSNGVVFVNSVALIEPYIAEQPAYIGSWQVPEDSIFVLGDNRNHSSDSHSWGFVPLTDVVGKALVVYWPFPRVRLVTHHQPNLSAAAN